MQNLDENIRKIGIFVADRSNLRFQSRFYVIISASNLKNSPLFVVELIYPWKNFFVENESYKLAVMI